MVKYKRKKNFFTKKFTKKKKENQYFPEWFDFKRFLGIKQKKDDILAIFFFKKYRWPVENKDYADLNRRVSVTGTTENVTFWEEVSILLNLRFEILSFFFKCLGITIETE